MMPLLKRRTVRFSTHCALLAILSMACGAARAEAPTVLSLDKVAGVYRESVEIGLEGSDRIIKAESILEIVKETKTTAYIRTRLYFHNRHTCNLWGIAEVKGIELIYRSAELDGETDSPCILTLSFDDGQIVFNDTTGQCRISRCGARGGFTDTNFDLSRRRDISYLDRIRRSAEYKQAVTEYGRLKPQ
jgi:hypothetical protein